ncbi:ankyrin repeat-containing domain protein [Ilyonectria destructans]|nr:ankyrin repeat-containing domain protein [Ilyonectria destructans]
MDPHKDPINESGEKTAVKLVEEFKSLLQRLLSIGLKQFHICFTCRHYPILDLDGMFEVCAEKENRKDISTFVQDKLSSFRGRTSSTIPGLITNRADGGAGLKEIEAVILSVPQELDALYRDLIRNIGSESLNLIQWICFATRPLSLDELRWAMLVEADCPHRSLHECQTAGDSPSDHDGMKRRVQTLSRGLAEVTSDAKVVQFIHQSVKDFFVEKGLSALDESAKPDFVVGIAHHRLSRTCIRYLAMEEIGQLASYEHYRLRSKFPFLHYATTSWVAHTKQSDARRVPQEDLLQCFTWPSNTLVERWVRVYGILQQNSGDCPPEGTSLIHVMSRYGVAGALGAILERRGQSGINIDAKDSHGRTPLSWAAENGHEAVVRLLVDRGAHTEAADKKGRTPLLRAAKNGHEAVVRLLVDRGAHTEAADRKGRTPLSWAAADGREAVVRLLQDRIAPPPPHPATHF